MVFGFNAGDSRFIYRADLSTMTQTNLFTGKTRPLACQARVGGQHNHQQQPQLQPQMQQFAPPPPAPHQPHPFGTHFGNPPHAALPQGRPQASAQGTPEGRGTGTGRHPMEDVLDQCVDVTDQITSDDDMCISEYIGPSSPAWHAPAMHHDLRWQTCLSIGGVQIFQYLNGL